MIEITGLTKSFNEHLVLNRLSLTVKAGETMVVIGRSDTLSAKNRRKLKAMDNEQPRLRVMTYDDVYENAKAVIENLLGPIWDSVGETQIYYLR